MSWNLRAGAAALVCLALACAAPVAAEDDCGSEQQFDSTFALIQNRIFDGHGCSALFCHSGAQPQGGLDLTDGNAYASLIDQPSRTVADAIRVIPGQKDQSLLWINLAAKTTPDAVHAPLRAMPPDPFPALSADELEALRRWIEVGAPHDSVVAGTADLLKGCLPPPKPIEIEPLPPPPAGEGVQLKMPRWVLPPHSEREVCFASYYDITDQVPEELRQPDGTFRYKRAQVRQDPLSHHLIVNRYEGKLLPATPDGWPVKSCAGGIANPHTGQACTSDADCGGAHCQSQWPEFHCLGGARDGETCNPLELGECGDGSACATAPVVGVACIGFGPPDADLGIASSGLLGSQETAAVFDNAPGVYEAVPMKGMIFWNSHAFNLTDAPGKLEAWLNFYFAAPDEQIYPVGGIFDTSEIFAADVAPFTAEEVCNHDVLPPNAQLFELSSHTHKRGKRFRTFLGKFSCSGGPNDGGACDPLPPDPGRPASDPCAGAPCGAEAALAAGDCDQDGTVGIDELLLGVNIALGRGALAECPPADTNDDSSVTIDEVVSAVASALQPLRDPSASLLYTNLIYNDPLVKRFDPPLSFPGSGSSDAARTLTYCSVYDNGLSDPSAVKRRSTSPPTPLGVPGVFGGPCVTPVSCTEGRPEEPCAGDTLEERNASCDSSPGAGDGFCDACTLTGGVTTEDEMFILMGSFYVK